MKQNLEIMKDRSNPNLLETAKEVIEEAQYLQELLQTKSIVETMPNFISFNQELFKKTALEFSEKILDFLTSKSGEHLRSNNNPTEVEFGLLKEFFPHQNVTWCPTKYYRLTVKEYRLDQFLDNFMYGISSLHCLDFAKLLSIQNNSNFLEVRIREKLKEMLPYKE